MTPPDDYISSGRFRADLEAQVGPLAARDPAEDEDDEDDEDVEDVDYIAQLPGDLAREVSALRDVLASVDVSLLRLRPGSFTTVPAQYDLDADGVREEEWFHDDHDIDVVMQSVELFAESGTSYLAGPFGIVRFSEDPHGYASIADCLEPFLRTLIALEGAVRGTVTPDAAEEVARSSLVDGPTSKSRRPSRPAGAAPSAATAPSLPRFVEDALRRARER